MTPRLGQNVLTTTITPNGVLLRPGRVVCLRHELVPTVGEVTTVTVLGLDLSRFEVEESDVYRAHEWGVAATTAVREYETRFELAAEPPPCAWPPAEPVAEVEPDLAATDPSAEVPF